MTPAEPHEPTLGRLVPSLVLAVWATVIVLSIRSSQEASELWRRGLDQIEPARTGVYVWIPVTLATGVFAAVVVRRAKGRMIATAAVGALVLAAVLGSARAGFDNVRVTYPTGVDGPSPLVDLAATSPNRTVASRWATFILAEEVLAGADLVVPSDEETITEDYKSSFSAMSGVRLVEQDYRPELDSEDPVLSGTRVFERAINDELALIVVGDAERYIVRETADALWLVAQP